MDTKNNQLQLNFDGFYESYYSYMIDERIDAMIDDIDLSDNEAQAYIDSIDFMEAQNDISKMIVESFNNLVFNDLEDKSLYTAIVFDGLYSPKFYNFETDSILLKDNDLMALYKLYSSLIDSLAINDSYNDLLSDYTTSKSGYIAFYTLESIPLNHIVNVMIESLYNYYKDDILEYLYGNWSL